MTMQTKLFRSSLFFLIFLSLSSPSWGVWPWSSSTLEELEEQDEVIRNFFLGGLPQTHNPFGLSPDIFNTLENNITRRYDRARALGDLTFQSGGSIDLWKASQELFTEYIYQRAPEGVVRITFGLLRNMGQSDRIPISDYIYYALEEPARHAISTFILQHQLGSAVHNSIVSVLQQRYLPTSISDVENTINAYDPNLVQGALARLQGQPMQEWAPQEVIRTIQDQIIRRNRLQIRQRALQTEINHAEQILSRYGVDIGVLDQHQVIRTSETRRLVPYIWGNGGDHHQLLLPAPYNPQNPPPDPPHHF